jgi:hypothetical protein
MGAPGLEPEMLRTVVLPLKKMLNEKGCSLRLVTILRDPVSRIVSQLHYSKIPEEHAQDHMFSSTNINYESRFLLRGYPTWDAPWWKESISNVSFAAEARDLLKNFDAVGQTENLGSFVSYIKQTLHCSLPDQIHHSNPADYAYYVNETTLQRLRAFVRGDNDLYCSYCGLNSVC